MDLLNKFNIMKKIYSVIIIAIIAFSCADDTNLLDQIATRGGYVEFVEVPDTRFNVLKLEEAGINAELNDPNNNILNYSLSAIYEGDTISNIFETSSFPTTIDLPLTDIIEPFGLTLADITVNTEIKLFAIITTPTGVYSGLSPEFVNNNSENIGGQTVNRLKEPNMNNAVEIDIIFFQPPPKALRMTSFEEPAALATLDNRYTKPGAADVSEPLPNYPGGPILNYVSQGSSVDDELGFTSEFISTGNGGFTYEHIGVNDNLAHFDFHKDGNQSFKIEDVDGIFKMTFETVNVPENEPQTGVQLSVFFRDSGWESADSFHAYANVVSSNGSTSQVDIAPLIRGNDIDAVAGEWLTYDTGFLGGIQSYEVIIEAESSNFQEDLYWDLLVIYVPDEE
jgi:hypothetical protein